MKPSKKSIILLIIITILVNVQFQNAQSRIYPENDISSSQFSIYGQIIQLDANETLNYGVIETQLRENYATTENETWYEEKIDMLIITKDEAHALAMEPLAEWKTTKGVPTKIINSTEYLTYDGFDVVEKIRNCIKDYYERYGIIWVLLAGDADIIPMREVYNPDSAILDDFHEYSGSPYYKPTDFYYAELTGNWDSNVNGKFGESLRYNDVDEIEWVTEVYVGRFPGKSAFELGLMVNKTINYEKNPFIGDWMNNILLGGAIQGKINSEDSDGEEESFLVEKILEESIPDSMDAIKLIETNHPITGFRETNFTRSLFNQYVDSGSSLVFYAGHGSPYSFDGLLSQSKFYTQSDAAGAMNNYTPSLFYADACSTNYIDGIYDSLGETLIKHENGGAIGYIGGTRITWYYQNDTYDFGYDENLSLVEMNRGMARLFFKEMFVNSNYQQGKALYEMKQSYINSPWLKNNPSVWEEDVGSIYDYNIHNIEWERKNVLTYSLLGDPETNIYTAIPEVFEESYIFNESIYYEGAEINFILQDSEGYPISEALISITGEDGAYNYFTSDIEGRMRFILPASAQRYNYTISAHNMQIKQGSFDVIEDNNPPFFISEPILIPSQPTVENNIVALINASDAETEVSSCYLLTSIDGFNTYTVYEMEVFQDNECFRVTLPKMKSGDYSYLIYIFDFGGNSDHTILNENQRFNIPTPAFFVILVVVNVFILLGILTFVFRKNFQFRRIHSD